MHRIGRSVLVSILLVLLSPHASGSVLATDSLTKRQKQTINTLAESKLKEYMNLLEAIAFLSGSDEDALTAEEFITAAVAGEDRTFRNAEATIESNVDPELRADALSRNRKAQEYLNDLKLHFKKEGDKAVDYTLLMRAEPQVLGGLVSTRLMYESRLLGRNDTRPGTAYKTCKRVAELIAEDKGGGNWRVTIVTDAYLDTSRAFVQFSVDRDLAALKQGTLAETPELTALREAEEAERKATAEVEARKKMAYADAIKAGKDAVASGEFDAALTFFNEARRYDPFAIEPLVAAKEAEKARKIKQQRDEKDFNDLMVKSKVLRGMNDYARALDACQRASVIIPTHPGCKPMIDSLDALVKTKADRERFIDAGDFQASLAEAQALLKTPGLADDPDLRVLQARSLRGLNKRADALKVLDEVLKRFPNHGEALRTRADILRNGTAEERAKAAPNYMVLMNRDVWDVSSYHHFAMLLCFDQGNCKEAVNTLQSALDREPGNAQTLYLLGRVNSVDGFKDYKTALRYVDGSIERDSTCGKCWLERGIVLLELDSTRSAESAIARANALGLDASYAARADSMAVRNYQQAKRLIEMQGRDNADRIFLKACVLDPEQPGYRFEKAQNLHFLKKYAEAIVDLDHHIERTQAPYAALLLRASCKVYTGSYAEARADADQILRNQVASFMGDANLVAGQAAYYMGDIGPAEAHFKETLRLNKKSMKANQFMTLISIESGRLDEARSYGQKAVDLDASAENYMNLGRALQASKDVNGSVNAFKEALRLGADRSEVEKQIGKTYWVSGKYKDALPHFEAQKLLKDDLEVPRMAADCHFKLERYTDAVGELNQLMAKYPEVETDIDFVSRLSYLYVLTGELNTAKTYLDKAVAMDKANSLRNSQLQLSEVAFKWKNGDKNGAVDELHGLVERKVFTEKQLKEVPVLKDIVSDRLWKSK